jgi:hypothetical protein
VDTRSAVWEILSKSSTASLKERKYCLKSNQIFSNYAYVVIYQRSKQINTFIVKRIEYNISFLRCIGEYRFGVITARIIRKGDETSDATLRSIHHSETRRAREIAVQRFIETVGLLQII